MATRTLTTAPPPRPQAPTPPPPRRPPTRKRSGKKPATTARRRVHVTIGRDLAAELRRQAAGSSNTEILIAAFGVDIEAPEPEPGPFAPRKRDVGKEGVYFYLAPSEIAHIDGIAAAAGYPTRSAVIDAALRNHLL